MATLEDTYLDVIGKARSGAGMSEPDLIRNAGISTEQWHALLGGAVDADVLRRIAGPLRLHADGLLRLARGDYTPPSARVRGLRQISTPFSMGGYEGLMVNAYIVWDPATKVAAVFDTGTDAAPILQCVSDEGLRVEHIFLTHTHHDHVEALGPLQKGLGDAAPPVHVHSSERRSGMLSIDRGTQVHLGSLRIQPRLTSGHSPGGMTYVIQGLKRPLAIVGDALYAGSAGGARNWESALAAVVREVLTLPPETVLCPGHGPQTTVAYERANNPLFPGVL